MMINGDKESEQDSENHDCPAKIWMADRYDGTCGIV